MRKTLFTLAGAVIVCSVYTPVVQAQDSPAAQKKIAQATAPSAPETEGTTVSHLETGGPHKFTVSAYGGPAFYPASFSSPTVASSEGSVSLEPAITMNYAFNSDFSVEVGVAYLTRNSTTHVSSTASGQGLFTQTDKWTSHAISIPVLARYSFKRYFSVAGGPFAEAGVGKVSVDKSDSMFKPTGGTASPYADDGHVEMSFTDNKQKSTDWGLAASFMATYPLMAQLDGAFNILYMKGLTEQSTDSTITLKNADLLFLFGLNYKF